MCWLAFNPLLVVLNLYIWCFCVRANVYVFRLFSPLVFVFLSGYILTVKWMLLCAAPCLYLLVYFYFLVRACVRVRVCCMRCWVRAVHRCCMSHVYYCRRWSSNYSMVVRYVHALY